MADHVYQSRPPNASRTGFLESTTVAHTLESGGGGEGSQADSTQGGKKIALRGGGWHGSPFLQPPPPPPWSPCREGGVGWGCPTCRAGGGGVRPQHTCLKVIPTSR